MARLFDVQRRRVMVRVMDLLGQSLRPAAKAETPEPYTPRQGETFHRLQVGLIGLGAMVLLVGVANMIMDRAQEVEDTTVPEAAPTVEPSPTPTQNKALENAGVVPDLPSDVVEEPVPQGPVLPEQGEGAEPQGQ